MTCVAAECLNCHFFNFLTGELVLHNSRPQWAKYELCRFSSRSSKRPILCKVPASPQKPCVSTFKATACCATVSGFATWLNRKFMQSYQWLAWFSQTACVGKSHTFWSQGGCVCLDYLNIITVIPARAVKEKKKSLGAKCKKINQNSSQQQEADTTQSRHSHMFDVPGLTFILAWLKKLLCQNEVHPIIQLLISKSKSTSLKRCPALCTSTGSWLQRSLGSGRNQAPQHQKTTSRQSCHFRFYQIIWTQFEYKASYFKHDLSCIDPQPLFDRCQ